VLGDYQWFAISIFSATVVATVALLKAFGVRTLLGTALLVLGLVVLGNGALVLPWERIWTDHGRQIVALLEAASVGLSRKEEQLYIALALIVLALVVLISSIARSETKG
jgi:hypothetical protein